MEENEWDGPMEQRHQLTIEDAKKGGQASSERKKKANAIRALKHGKYAKTLEGFEFCDSCIYKSSCMAYKSGSACQLRLALLKEINKVAGPQAAQSWLNVQLKIMQSLYVLSKAAPDERQALKDFEKAWREFGKLMFPRRIEISGNVDKEIKVVFEGGEDDGDSEDSV